MRNLIDRQAAIDVIIEDKICDDSLKIMTALGDGDKAETLNMTCDRHAKMLMSLPPAQPNNQVNLCDSCKYSYPDCPSETDDVIFGNGKGNDNICTCNKYLPSAQPEPEELDFVQPHKKIGVRLEIGQPDRSLWFRIGEICVEESKGFISPGRAVEKIRELLREAERREE